MKIEQIYTGCMAQAAYYLESNGEAAIFDPLREVGPYIEKAAADKAQIKYIFETHFHADFVSGHLDLAQKTGATIVYGPTAQPGFEALIATDEQEFNKIIKYQNTTGASFETPMGEILIHLTHHGAYHRGQIISLLKPIVNPLPATDYIVWLREN